MAYLRSFYPKRITLDFEPTIIFNGMAEYATINVKASDAKQDGFSVDLKDGTDGSVAIRVASNVESGSAQYNDSAQKKIIVLADGNYYIEVTANKDASWQVDVSQ